MLSTVLLVILKSWHIISLMIGHFKGWGTISTQDFLPVCFWNITLSSDGSDKEIPWLWRVIKWNNLGWNVCQNCRYFMWLYFQQTSLNATLIDVYEWSRTSDKQSFLIANSRLCRNFWISDVWLFKAERISSNFFANLSFCRASPVLETIIRDTGS